MTRAISNLSDAELARLAERAQQAQYDFAAGALSKEALLIIAIAVVVVIIVIAVKVTPGHYTSDIQHWPRRKRNRNLRSRSLLFRCAFQAQVGQAEHVAISAVDTGRFALWRRRGDRREPVPEYWAAR